MKRFVGSLTMLIGVAAFASDAVACAVCMGNRESHMVKGAESGVLTLILVTYVMLIGFCGICAMWAIRARRLRIASDQNVGPSNRSASE